MSKGLAVRTLILVIVLILILCITYILRGNSNDELRRYIIVLNKSIECMELDIKLHDKVINECNVRIDNLSNEIRILKEHKQNDVIFRNISN